MIISIFNALNLRLQYYYLFWNEMANNQTSNSGEGSNQEENDIVVANKTNTELPKKYKVLLHNDDYTTMEFVVMILQKIFFKNLQEAQTIMFSVHRKGFGVCGVYTFEVAETKVYQVKKMAKEFGYPLKCTYEAE